MALEPAEVEKPKIELSRHLVENKKKRFLMVSVELEHLTTRKKEVCYFKLSGQRHILPNKKITVIWNPKEKNNNSSATESTGTEYCI